MKPQKSKTQLNNLVKDEKIYLKRKAKPVRVRKT